MDCFFDSYAVIEIIKNNQDYLEFKEKTIITDALNIAEVHYFLIEYASESEADKIIKSLNVELKDLDKDTAVNASKFRHKNKKLKLSYADCLGYILAKNNNLLFLTGDDAFKEFENVRFIK